MTAILLDGSHWMPDLYSSELRSPQIPTLLRLYRDKAIAGYLLSGVPELRPIDPFMVDHESVNLVKYVTH